MSCDPTDPNFNRDECEDDIVIQAGLINSADITLPASINGRDRYVTIEKKTPETVSPLVKRDVSVDGIYEVIDTNFSYPLTAHVGLKFDSRTFSNLPKREFDVKMKKIKVPSNYYPIGGNGLDRRYVFANPDYLANPNNLDVIFLIDQNINAATRNLLKRNLQQFVSKLASGYLNIRFSIWKTAASGTDFVVNQSTSETINNFTYHNSKSFFELETPDSTGANITNLIELLNSVLNESQLSPSVNPSETSIANFFFRKTQFSASDQIGKASEADALSELWTNTVRKVIYISGSSPEIMTPETYQISLNRAREAKVHFYYLHTDSDYSKTRTLRELAEDTGGAKFNLLHDSDIALQQFCDTNFYDSNKIYYGDWDGTFKIEWTDNPAWILYDIITDFTYGLGNYIDNSSIDKWTLYDIGRYCDAVDDDGRFRGVPDGKGGLEPRYTCNTIYYNKDEAYTILKDVAAIFKGIIYWNTEGFSFSADKGSEPLMYFGNTNVKDGLFNYSDVARNKRYTSVEVTYNDKYDNYKTKIEYIEDVDGIRELGLNPFKVNAAGCTSRSEARRIGKYILFSSINESDTVTFTAGLEGAYLQPGDIFGVSDEVKNVGRTFGRILEVNEASNTIKIDGEFHPDLASGIYIHVPSGNFSVSSLSSLTGIDGGFTGTLEQIRARRQSQTRKFNLHTVTDDSYGATLTVTGDYLLQSAIVEVYPIQQRALTGADYTGLTTLTGSVYRFPAQTVAPGNPRWDSLTYQNITGIFSDLEVDIDFSGTADYGQTVSASTPSWEVSVSGKLGSNSLFLKVGNGSEVAISSPYIYNYNSAGTLVDSAALGTTFASANSNSVYVNAATDSLLVIAYPIGGLTSSSVPLLNEGGDNIYQNNSSTEASTIGKDDASSASQNSYAMAFIKGGWRCIEFASKRANERGGIKFNYKDLLAFSKLRGYFTLMQADVGNRNESNFGLWQAGAKYVAGDVVKVDGSTYLCVRDHDKSASTFVGDYINQITRTCNVQSGNKNIALTTQDPAQVAGIVVGMIVEGAGIAANSTVTDVGYRAESVTVSVSEDPTATNNNTTLTFKSRQASQGGNNIESSKWTVGNSNGYYTIAFPKNFYGETKYPSSDDSARSEFVTGAFGSLGMPIYYNYNNVAALDPGGMYQTDLSQLPEEKGIGYSGVVIGTGFPKGFYSLSVDTNPKNLDLISEGSLYILSGSGVEPKLYKTIATKEEEANQYSVVGIEYVKGKEDYIENDIMDTSPSYYVRGPYDVVVKPNEPSGIQSVSGYGAGSTGVHIIWSGTDSPITGYKVYVSRPDYSTLSDEYDSVTEVYSVPSGTTQLTVPVSGIFGQYDFDIYSQGTWPYKLLSTTPVSTGKFILPNATLTGKQGFIITSTIPSGFTIDTADKNSVYYDIEHIGGGTYAGLGRGNFTSADVTFRWKYIDPTGGVMATKEQIYQNPFVDLPQKVTVQILDNAGQVLQEIKEYQGLSFTVTKDMNGRLFNQERDSVEDIEYSRSLGLRVIVTDNTNLTKTGTFFADNPVPSYTEIEVIDSYQNSPYWVLSGYYGNSTFTGIALWRPENNTTIGIITGSGIRNSQGNLIRSEDENNLLTFAQISGAFVHAIKFNGTGVGSAVSYGNNVDIINYRGTGDPDYEAYVYAYEDLIDVYTKYGDKSLGIEGWGEDHYLTYGINEGREVPNTKGNPLGIANLNDITQANKTGFSGVSFTVLTEEVSKGEIIFNCLNSSSNKDVYNIDVYTGSAANFVADPVNNTNLFRTVAPNITRSYINTIKLGEGLPTEQWTYFQFVPWDDFGPGPFSDIVSGYLEAIPEENPTPSFNTLKLNGGRNQDFDPIDIPNNRLVKDFNYKIIQIGASINWTSIGLDAETAQIGAIFKYNGTSISGNGGRVERVESVFDVPVDYLGESTVVELSSDSAVRLPADVPDGSSIEFINLRSEYKLYILDGEEEISVITPNNKASLRRIDSSWFDPQGNSLEV